MSSNIIDYRSLDSWDLQMPSFSEYGLTNTTEGIKLEGSVTRFNFKTQHGQKKPFEIIQSKLDLP